MRRVLEMSDLTGTSDSVRAWLSNGEYIIKAASVRKYGTGVLDALNRGNE